MLKATTPTPRNGNNRNTFSNPTLPLCHSFAKIFNYKFLFYIKLICAVFERIVHAHIRVTTHVYKNRDATVYMFSCSR